MRELNPDFVSELIETINACNFFQLLSMRLEALCWGASELTVAAREKHLQPYGIVHGGVCASLIDAACFWAVFSQAPEDSGLTTVDLKLNYLAPVISGELRAEGECIKLGRQIGLATARVKNEKGELVAHGASTLMVLQGHQLQSGSPATAKYLD